MLNRWTTLLALAVAAGATIPSGPLLASEPTSPPNVLQDTSGVDAVGVQMLTRMLKAQRTLQYTGDQVTTLYGASGTTTVSEQIVTRDGLRGMRMDYRSPDTLAGESRGDNGSVLWHNIPRRNRIERLPSAIGSLKRETNRALATLKQGALAVHVMGNDTVAGVNTCVVQARALINGGTGTRRFWIDPATGAQLRIVVYRPDGSPASDSYFKQITFGQITDKSVFDPPTGSPVATQQSDHPFKEIKLIPPGIVPGLKFDPLEPEYLPAGFHFNNAQLFKYKGSPALGIRYYNGITNMSIYEAPASTTDDTSRFKIARPGMLTGICNGLQIILLANIDSGELVRVFQSLR